jgi:AraC family cel operon transcriptional repressor
MSRDDFLCHSDVMDILRWANVGGKNAFHAARSMRTRQTAHTYHGHDFAELFWIDSGRGIHRVNGESVPLPTRSLVLIRPADCHRIDQADAHEIRLTNIAFPRETLQALGQRYFGGQAWGFWHEDPLPATFSLEPSQLLRFNRWADELSRAPQERLHIERFLLNVLAELSLERPLAALDDAPDWLIRACDLIQEPENFSGGVEKFLQLCGRSREHAARTVRRHFGMTPTDYVNRVRIDYARRQLEMGSQEILEIALDCGIGNLSHFYGLFHAQTGTTPRKYRLAHRRAV